jgi:fibronectin-binding autotransporter adhesin
VTSCTETDLRAALDGGGRVTFACDGVLQLSSPLLITNDTTLDASGHDLTLAPGPVLQPIRLLQINPGVSLGLSHMTLANGFVRGTNSTVTDGTGGTGFGGAVWNNAGTLQATDCVFTNNAVLGGTGGPSGSSTPFNLGGAGLGGAIYNDQGALYLTNVVFAGNAAQGGQGGAALPTYPSRGGSGGYSCGGAIYSRTGLIAMANCRFVSNSAPASLPGPANGYNPSSGYAYAGALYSISGTNVIVETRFERQWVGGGRWFCDANAGAIYQAAGALWVSGCTFATNQVRGGDGIIIGSGSNAGSAMGGALMLNAVGTGEQGQTKLYCDAVLSNCCFVGNIAKGGIQGPAVGSGGTAYGGVVVSTTTLRMLNCTLAANVASGGDITYPSYPLSYAYGGALCTMGGTALLTHVTMVANGSSRGVGAGTSYLARGGGIYVSSGKVYLRNSLLAANTADSGANGSGTLNDDGCNLSSDATCLFTAPGSRNNTDPQLLPLGAYGGPTLTSPPRPGSPALDAANPAFGPPTDQRGLSRPQGAGYDIGAVEAAALSLQRLTDGSWLLFETTLPAAACTLHTSTNLTDWSVLQLTNADARGQVEFQVPDDGLRARFFRTSGLP